MFVHCDCDWSLLTVLADFFLFLQMLMLLNGTLTMLQKAEKTFYVLLPYIIYVMESGSFPQSPAFLSRTAKEGDKKYSVKTP